MKNASGGCIDCQLSLALQLSYRLGGVRTITLFPFEYLLNCPSLSLLILMRRRVNWGKKKRGKEKMETLGDGGQAGRAVKKVGTESSLLLRCVF